MPADTSKPAAIGAVRELLIEGPILARGYLNNPGKTPSLFIEDLPWMKDFRPADGTFRFIRQKDTQAKLQGQRLELGEVEFRTRQCLSEVHNVVAKVIVPSGSNANSLLVAFVHLTMTSDDSNNMFLSPAEELLAIFSDAQTKLKGMVPGYIVPRLFRIVFIPY
ncbi:hypothetical protein SNK05_013313 [Fusarium graminearum]